MFLKSLLRFPVNVYPDDLPKSGKSPEYRLFEEEKE
jgi:hypothetical protein